MKKVSIIMPVYNGEEYISEAIDSIINQSYKNWELIIVNEYGSSKASLEIIKSYLNKDKRIILIQNNKKEGISESLNIGLRYASGDYLARMDSDDISGLDRIKKQVDFLDNNKNIGLCGIVPTFIGTEEIYWDIETNPDQIKTNIFFYTPCVHPSIMFRREIIDKYNIYYNKNYKATEDYDFFSRVIGVTNIANINDKTLFNYRMYSTNATNRNNDIGIKIYSEIMRNCFKNYLKLNFTDEEIDLLDCHISVNSDNENNIYKSLIKLDLLLKKILYNASINNYDINYMFKTLKKRWNELKWSISNTHKTSAIEFLLDKSIFNRDYFCANYAINKNFSPDITILMPVYNSENYILDSVLSILDQSYKNFILYIMIEFDNNDNTEKYLEMLNDNRIKIIRNEKKLGLANTLNKGIKMSKTEFIARMDSDDLSNSTRLEKERKFLIEHRDVALVSTWQRHFGEFGTYIHKSACNSDDLAATLLFKCDICHSTIMFRREIMLNNNYFYNPDMAMEDFDLWNRMLKTEKLACIPEVLGEYRIHENNITQAKHLKVINSEISIVSRNLENLGIKKGEYDEKLLIGWDYLYNEEPELKIKAEKLFQEILINNKNKKIYNQESLKNALNKRMDWIYGTDNYVETEVYKSTKIDKKLKKYIKKFIKPIIMPFYSRLMYRVNTKIIENNENFKSDLNNQNEIIKNYINSKFDELEKEKIRIDNLMKKVNKQLQLLNQCNTIYTPYTKGKIRIAIIFQIPSFWPSIESVYTNLLYDDRFEMKFYLIDHEYKEPSQMAGAKKFLNDNNIKYEILNIELLNKFNPHVAVIQTPYDEWHREKEFSSESLKKMGIRLVYIPYGIEFSGTEESLKLQFCSQFINNMWRIYTLSEVTQKYYCLYSNHTLDDVKALGHPKFDGLIMKKYTTNYNFKLLAKKRKIVLIKIHFPKFFNGKQVTPDLNIYSDFLDKAYTYKNIFFIIMLHPLMYDKNKNSNSQNLIKKLKNSNNIYIFNDEDYREPMLSADAFICDRSSLAIEIAPLNKPILFLENKDITERYLEEFNCLFNSYRKGYELSDIEKFLNDILEFNNDNIYKVNKEFKKCVTLYDSNSGKRIVNDIFEGVINENKK